MEMEPGKLFVGGISWDTNDSRLKEYFQTFGEVVEAMIMKDRNTGRARGFGFVVFADPTVAERVVKEKHVIDGRMVEAKKAVPRDDQNMVIRNSSSIQGSLGPARTKKIFVGGLASNVTESEFKRYFDQFGTITDVVVMYDHNTQRPRGFGFITYESEEAVDKVLVKTFHELNGKMVEVKRAVPKELSPGPSRSQLGGYNYSMGRVSNLLNTYAQGYNLASAGGQGLRIDGRLSPVTLGRSGYPTFSHTGYGMGLNFEPGLSPGFGGSGDLSSSFAYGRGLNSFYGGSPNRYSSTVGYGGGAVGSGTVLSSSSRSLWLNGGQNYATSSATSEELVGSGIGSTGLVGAFGPIGTIWGSSPASVQGGSTGSTYNSGNFSYSSAGSNIGSTGMEIYRRNIGSSALPTLSHIASGDGLQGPFGNLYGDGSSYGDSRWRSPSPDLGGTGSFDYGSSNLGSNINANNPAGYIGGYSVTNRSTRGIAT